MPTPRPALPVDDPALFAGVRALVQQGYGRKALVVPDPALLEPYGLIQQKRFVRATLWVWAPDGYDLAVEYLRDVEDRRDRQERLR